MRCGSMRTCCACFARSNYNKYKHAPCSNPEQRHAPTRRNALPPPSFAPMPQKTPGICRSLFEVVDFIVLRKTRHFFERMPPVAARIGQQKATRNAILEAGRTAVHKTAFVLKRGAYAEFMRVRAILYYSLVRSPAHLV